MKCCQSNISFRILFKVKLLFKCVAYIMYKMAIEHMGIKIREVSVGKVTYISYLKCKNPLTLIPHDII